jgi:TIR domain
MLNVFISYERESKRLVGPLADDIKVLGHTVWFDQELSGGQAWWDQILAQVRSCEKRGRTCTYRVRIRRS